MIRRASQLSHTVSLRHRDVKRLRAWLDSPNGSLRMERVVFEAVEGGGILVRTDAWQLHTE